jgi:hypothetical protein
MAVWRDGITGAIGAKAVDMMDNAKRCPHAHSRNNSSRQHVWLHIRRSERPRFQLTNRARWSYRWGPPHYIPVPLEDTREDDT